MVFIEVVYKCKSINDDNKLLCCYNNIHEIKEWCKSNTKTVESEIYRITKQGWIFVGDKKDVNALKN